MNAGQAWQVVVVFVCVFGKVRMYACALQVLGL